MKYLLSFLFGAVVGAGGTLLWLRKDIKKELDIRSKASESDDMPFTMGEGNDTGNGLESLRGAKNGLRSENDIPMAIRKETKVEYNKIINAVKSGEEVRLEVPILPREDYPEAHYEEEAIKPENEEEKERDCFPIDVQTFTHDNDYDKDRLIYFEGDKIMCTENGSVIDSPAIFVGADWSSAVGRDVDSTAFIRNPKMNTDYAIIVEEGLYQDEFGPPD